MKLIDKDAVIEEIGRRIRKYEKEYDELAKYEVWITAREIAHKIQGLKEALSILDAIEVKEEETNSSPSKKQLKAFKDLLDYNIGVFDYQKFMEVYSLYNDLIKLCN